MFTIFFPTRQKNAEHSHAGDRLVGLVVKASTSRADDPGFESRLRRDFPGSSHTSDFKIGTSVASLPGAWRYRVSAGTGRPASVYCDWMRWKVGSAGGTRYAADPLCRRPAMPPTRYAADLLCRRPVMPPTRYAADPLCRRPAMPLTPIMPSSSETIVCSVNQ